MRSRAWVGLGLIVLLGFGISRSQQTPKAETANWVWSDEGDPLASAPAGSRYFRRVLTLEMVPAKAELSITADNGFVAWLNGTRVGEGDQWQQMYRFDVAKHLRAGKNVLAVEARNDGGPAGLVAKLDTLLVTD